MNIFVLDLDPRLCASFHCDKHLVKMITEHNQILGSVFHITKGVVKRSQVTEEYRRENFLGFPRLDENGIPHPYGIGYRTHPCTQWAALSKSNYDWLCMLNMEMCREYTERYSKTHAGEIITSWYSKNSPEMEDLGITPFALAMPASCKVIGDPVKSYRLYYAAYKSYFAKWKSNIPSWWPLSIDEAKRMKIVSERCIPFV